MIRYILGLLIAGTIVCFWFWGWKCGVAWFLGSLLHVFFYWLMRKKYLQWVRESREPDWMGRRLLTFTMLRFLLEILCCVAVIFSPLNILAFLGGLLTLPVATLGERLVSLIKE